MTVYNRDDVVLIGFLLSGESAKKLRPASSLALRLTTVRDKRSSSPRSRATPNAASSAIICSRVGRGPGSSSRPW